MRKEKHLKNVIAHYKIHEHYIRIYKSALNYWLVEASGLNCSAETLVELEINLRRIKVASKMMLEMHPHILVCKEPFKSNSLSLLLFEVDGTEGIFSWNPGRLNYKQNFYTFKVRPSKCRS